MGTRSRGVRSRQPGTRINRGGGVHRCTLVISASLAPARRSRPRTSNGSRSLSAAISRVPSALWAPGLERGLAAGRAPRPRRRPRSRRHGHQAPAAACAQSRNTFSEAPALVRSRHGARSWPGRDFDPTPSPARHSCADAASAGRCALTARPDRRHTLQTVGARVGAVVLWCGRSALKLPLLYRALLTRLSARCSRTHASPRPWLAEGRVLGGGACSRRRGRAGAGEAAAHRARARTSRMYPLTMWQRAKRVRLCQQAAWRARARVLLVAALPGARATCSPRRSGLAQCAKP